MRADLAHGLGGAVAPAAFVSACALAALGLDNQASRLAVRLREAAAEMRRVPSGDPARPSLAARIAILGVRHGLVARALLLAYGAMAAFVLASTLALADRFFPLPPQAFATAFAAGAVLLAGMAACAAWSAALRLARGGPVPDWRALAAEAEGAGASEAALADPTSPAG